MMVVSVSRHSEENSVEGFHRKQTEKLTYNPVVILQTKTKALNKKMNMPIIFQHLDVDCSILYNSQEMDQLSEPREEC